MPSAKDYDEEYTQHSDDDSSDSIAEPVEGRATPVKEENLKPERRLSKKENVFSRLTNSSKYTGVHRTKFDDLPIARTKRRSTEDIIESYRRRSQEETQMKPPHQEQVANEPSVVNGLEDDPYSTRRRRVSRNNRTGSGSNLVLAPSPSQSSSFSTSFRTMRDAAQAQDVESFKANFRKSQSKTPPAAAESSPGAVATVNTGSATGVGAPKGIDVHRRTGSFRDTFSRSSSFRGGSSGGGSGIRERRLSIDGATRWFAGGAELVAAAPKELSDIYHAFCSFGAGSRVCLDMDCSKLLKLVRDAKMLDERLTPTEVELVFARSRPEGERWLDYEAFVSYTVPMLAAKKYPSSSSEEAEKAVIELMLLTGGPSTSNTTKCVNRKGSVYDRLSQHGGGSPAHSYTRRFSNSSNVTA